MAEPSGNTPLGSLEVPITGNLQPLADSIAQAKGLLAAVQGDVDAILNKAQEANKKIDAGGKGGTKKLNITLSVDGEKLAKDINAVLNKQYPIKLNITGLETQLKQFFENHEFTVKVNAQATGLTTAPGSTINNAIADQPRASRSIPPELEQAIKKSKKGVVELAATVHEEIADSFKQIGRDWGSVGGLAGKTADQMVDIFELLGNNLNDIAHFAPIKGGGGAQGIVGGSASAQGLIDRGIPPERAPIISSLVGRLIGPPNAQGQGLGNNVANIMGPVRQALSSSAGSLDTVAQAITQQARVMPTEGPSARVIKNAIEEVKAGARQTEEIMTSGDLKKIAEATISDRQKALQFIPFDPTRIGLRDETPTRRRRGSANSTRIAGSDAFTSPTAERAGFDLAESETTTATRDLGVGQRANNRRLRGFGGSDPFGLSTKLEPLLRLAEGGQLRDFFEQRTGERFDQPVAFGQISSSDVGGDDLLSEARRRQNGTTIPNLGEGKFFPIKPTEVIRRLLLQQAGGGDESGAVLDKIDEFMTARSEDISKAISAAPRSSGGPESSRGVIKPRLTGSGDLGKEAKRLYGMLAGIDQRIDDYSTTISRINDDIEGLAGTGQDTSGLERQAGDLSRQLGRLHKQRNTIKGYLDFQMGGGPSAEQYALIREEASKQSAASRGRVEQGVGLSEMEKAERRYNDPHNYAGRLQGAIGAGEVPDPEAILNELENRFFQVDPISERDKDTGEPTKGASVLTYGQRLRKAAYGDSMRKSKKDPTGLLGELSAGLDKDVLGTDEYKNARELIDTVIGSAVSQQGDAYKNLEERIKAREGLTRQRQLTRKDIERGLTGEGNYTTAPPGNLGKLSAQIAYEESLGPNHPSHDTHQELEDKFIGGGSLDPSGSAQAVQIPGLYTLREQLLQRMALQGSKDIEAQATRQKTLGKGTYQTGAETQALAEDAGIMTAESTRMPPFANMNSGVTRNPRPNEYGPAPYGITTPQRGLPGGPGGEPPTDERGRFDFGGGPIHVIVDNTPLPISWVGMPTGTSSGASSGRARGATSGGPAKAAAAKPMTEEEKREEELKKQAAAEAEARAKLLRRGRIRRLPKSFTSPEQRSAERLEQLSTAGFVAEEQDRADDELGPFRAQLRGAQRRVPKRGFGPSIVDLVTSGLGGQSFENQLEKLGRAEREFQELQSRTNERTQIRGRISGLVAQRDALPPNDARRAGIDQEIGRLNKQVAALNPVIAKSTDNFQKNIAAATGFGTVLKSFGAAAIGSSISTAIGAITVGLGTAVVQPIIQGFTEGLSQALGPQLERLSGFAETTGKVQTTLAQQQAQNNGITGVTIAQQAVAARLTPGQADLIGGPLGQRAETVAGNQALATQFDLLNAANAISQQNQGGFDRGLFRSTGGLADIQLPFKAFGVQNVSIGGEASTAERLTNQLTTLTSQQGIDTLHGRAALERVTGPSVLENPLGFLESQGDRDRRADASDQEANRLQDLNNRQLAFLNENLKDSGFQLRKTTDQDVLARQKDTFAIGRAPDLGGKLAEKGIEATGVNGPIDVAKLLAAIDKSAQQPSPAEILKTLEPQLQAREQQRTERRELQLNTLNPIEEMIARLTNPTAPAGSGIDLTGLSPAQKKAAQSSLAGTQELQNQLSANDDQERKAAVDFIRNGAPGSPGTGLGDAAAKDFELHLNNVAKIGQEISQIQVGIQTKQAAYQAAQFNYQLGLAKRNLSDARGLVSGVGDGLGALERQMYNLQRQSQALSLGQSQRQINFQQATAGFNAGGLTGEERAARIKQAKIEADYAQKQLDIQKKLYGLQGKSFNITASRQVTDLVSQIGLLERGRQINVETAVAEKRISALTKLQERENKKVNQYYSDAVSKTQDIMDVEAQLVAQTQKNLVTVRDAVIDTYRKFFKELTAASTRLLGDSNSENAGNTPLTGEHHAAGMVGMTTGPTDLGVAGEAGGEAVAIIKQPRRLTGLGGGGQPITIIVQGNKFSTKEEQDDLVRRLTYAVTAAQSRNLALTGLRNS